ncbi:MAG: hypothetical protein K0B08_04295 [Bacteroidales bacterium]|nr:hypothetical protein [Bacteroidales bacterium]
MNIQRNDPDWIEDYLDGTLSEPEQEEFRERLVADPSFAALYEQRLKLQQTWKETEKYAVVEDKVAGLIMSEKTAIRQRRNILLVAASLVAVIGVGSVLLFILPDRTTHKMQEAHIAADSAIQGPQQIGMPEYGKIDSVIKTDSYEITLLSPIDDNVFIVGETITFQWSASTGKSELVIKEKAGGRLVFNISLPEGKSEYMFETVSLTPGDYMWFVNDSLMVRHFMINKKP